MDPAEDAALVVAVAVIANLVDMTDALVVTTRGWMALVFALAFPGRDTTTCPMTLFHHSSDGS
jgi:hypothetical protein